MRSRIVVIVIAMFALAALLSGCGGGSSSGSGSGSSSGAEGSSSTASSTSETKPSGPPLTKKEFVKKAELVCQGIPTAYNENVAKLEKGAKKGSKPTESEKNLKAAVPADEAAVEELKALSPPQGDEQKIEAIIASLENAAKGLEEKPESELSGPKSPYAEWQKLTKAYGLEFCSSL